MPYIAVVLKESDDGFSVHFPDLPGCVTAGSTLPQARRFAAEALAFHLESMAAGRRQIPSPRPVEAIREEPGYRSATLIIVEPIAVTR